MDWLISAIELMTGEADVFLCGLNVRKDILKLRESFFEGNVIKRCIESFMSSSEQLKTLKS